jgi:tetratricopeptide (TPR) repeat protein
MNDLNKLSCRMYFIVATLRPAMLDSDQLRKTKSSLFRGRCVVLLAVVGLLTSYIAAQETSSKCFGGVVIHGTVLDSGRKPVSDAVVRLEPRPAESPIETTTNAAGVFTFSSPTDRSYHLFAEKSGLRTPAMDVTAVSGNCIAQMELILNMPGPTPGSNTVSQPVVKAMEFADQPNFAIAGVTDWTAVGGHGSDSTLRTSESLASETRDLKPDIGGSSVAGVAPRVPEDTETETKLRAALAKAPRSFSENNRLGEYYLRIGRYTDAISILESAYKIDPNNDANQYELVSTYDKSGDLPRAINRIHELLKNSQSADLYRLAGELDEKAGDPLSSVHEYERAAKLNPSEQNYFEWGSELLLHRAVWQAQEVFQRGADAYPNSVRMQMAMGAALFAGARYDTAALRFCKASDLDPTNPTPYIFMGKIQMSSPTTLACAELKLARYADQQPNSSVANYLYAMSILKSQEQLPHKEPILHAEALLTKALAIDPKCSECYLQLGIIASSDHSFDKAIGLYKKAIEADPQLVDAYYRLGVAYDRTAQPAKAKEQFQLHDKIKQQQAEIVEKQRRDVKQFLVVLSGQPTSLRVQQR